MKYILFKSNLANQQLSELLCQECLDASITLDQTIDETYSDESRELVVIYGIRTVPSLVAIDETDKNKIILQTDNPASVATFVADAEALAA